MGGFPPFSLKAKEGQETEHTQRLFTGLEDQAGTWPMPRWVVVKCEANAQGTNRRAVVANRPNPQRGRGGVPRSINSVPQQEKYPAIQLRTMATIVDVVNNPGSRRADSSPTGQTSLAPSSYRTPHHLPFCAEVA